MLLGQRCQCPLGHSWGPWKGRRPWRKEFGLGPLHAHFTELGHKIREGPQEPLGGARTVGVHMFFRSPDPREERSCHSAKSHVHTLAYRRAISPSSLCGGEVPAEDRAAPVLEPMQSPKRPAPQGTWATGSLRGQRQAPRWHSEVVPRE